METKFSKIYKRTLGRFIPRYSFLSVVFCFVLNSLIYTGLQIIMGKAKHYDLTTKFDDAIPFRPEWSIIYLGCFLFWAVNYIMIANREKQDWFRFATGDYMSRIVCAFFFIIIPTTNVRPEVVGNSFPEQLMKFVYFMDAPTNLFPSIHCLVSWLAYLGIKKRDNVPIWYRGFSAVFAILVFLSTLFTKQHFIIDVVGGVVLAEICYHIGSTSNLHLKVMKVFDAINAKVFGEEINEK